MRPDSHQTQIPYHDTLDISKIEKGSDSKPTVVFVTVPPLTQSITYEQVICGRSAIPELYVSKPTKDNDKYHGYVKLEEPINPPISPWNPPRQEPTNEDPRLLLHFTTPGSEANNTTIEFLLAKYSVDIFDEHRLYFEAEGNTIRVRDHVFMDGHLIKAPDRPHF